MVASDVPSGMNGQQMCGCMHQAFIQRYRKNLRMLSVLGKPVFGKSLSDVFQNNTQIFDLDIITFDRWDAGWLASTERRCSADVLIILKALTRLTSKTKWKRFCIWASQHQLSPLTPSISAILDYLLTVTGYTKPSPAKQMLMSCYGQSIPTSQHLQSLSVLEGRAFKTLTNELPEATELDYKWPVPPWRNGGLPLLSVRFPLPFGTFSSPSRSHRRWVEGCVSFNWICANDCWGDEDKRVGECRALSNPKGVLWETKSTTMWWRMWATFQPCGREWPKKKKKKDS